MARYAVRVRSMWVGEPVWFEEDSDDSLRREITVIEEDGSEDTGLLDARGHAIWRVPERVRCGFVK